MVDVQGDHLLSIVVVDTVGVLIVVVVFDVTTVVPHVSHLVAGVVEVIIGVFVVLGVVTTGADHWLH